ncbi:hypothetical protein [Methylocystis heyeri]|uniref:Surface antigen domain-containing protein n=1 Tax=Methylocystis heyeri TaxID=391905 RepID=A0A6B8KLR8_9HYPH|nr:hypothetical protein [Methylocystis heyeri]QGM47673.1 hypothetical protein H2LOC_019440 [Methylocystis heyeri]
MISSKNGSVANRVSQTILFIAATAGFLAAVAAAPAAPTDAKSPAQASAGQMSVLRDDASGMRPLARGPAIRVGRAFDAEDEDCTVTITRVTDENGHVHARRGLTCAN